MNATPKTTVTNQLYIPHVLNSVVLPGQIAHRRYPFVIPPVPIPYRPPYITRVRRLLAMSLPIVITFSASIAGEFELKNLESCAVDLFNNKLLLATVPVESVALQNPSTLEVTFHFEAFISANFQNPIDVTNTSGLELGCKGVTPSFTTAQTSMVVGADYNLQAVAPNEFVSGSGTFIYDEEDRPR